MMLHLKDIQRRGEELTVPSAVLVEVWRGGPRSARIAALLQTCIIEPLSEGLARASGEAISNVPGASVVDAIVMTSAALRGDRVITSDLEDLDRLRSLFPAVRLSGV
ncbi:MAG: putative toxin of system [Pseudomonadota bacterium]|jgi:hypothetical protein